MDTRVFLNVVLTILATFICIGNGAAQSERSPTNAPSTIGAKPLLLEKNEGELRVRRSAAASTFTLKVSPKDNGSQRLVLVEEDLSPGTVINRHKHLEQDEILLIQTGTAHIWLGDQERDLHAGGLVFIPQNTWISVKNIGTEPIHLVAIFSAPGFEDYMRCTSVPANEKPTPMTIDQYRACARQGHVVYAEKNAKN
ncbi:MAG TPA: cupin domain-containing protein [Candidatus Acidoferrales bacterium]|nr:cupin domain-containing protein [Candidatus Acidoferrales bacterium]